MLILIPLTFILAGIIYFAYQTIHYAKKCKQQSGQVKKLKLKLNQLTGEKQKPLCLNWKDDLFMKLFGQKTWIRYRQGYTRARFAINYFYPTCWISFFSLFNVLTKLLAKVFWQTSLNWFFWLSLATLPICGLILFYQWQRLKQIPLDERRSTK